MVRHSHAHRLIVGARIDSVFGRDGTSVDVAADCAVTPPPLNATLARDLVQRTRVAMLLEEGCNTPRADQEALNAVLAAVSQLLAEVPEIDELVLDQKSLQPNTGAGSRSFCRSEDLMNLLGFSRFPDNAWAEAGFWPKSLWTNSGPIRIKRGVEFLQCEQTH